MNAHHASLPDGDESPSDPSDDPSLLDIDIPELTFPHPLAVEDFTGDLSDEGLCRRAQAADELEAELPHLFDGLAPKVRSVPFLAGAITEQARTVETEIRWLNKVRQTASTSMERQEAARSLATSLRALTDGFRKDDELGRMGEAGRRAGEVAERLLLRLSLLQGLGRTRRTCRWERMWRWICVSLALFAAVAFASGSVTVAGALVLGRTIVALLLRPPMFDAQGQATYRADWAGCVMDHAGDALILVGVGSIILLEGSRWGVIPLVAAVVTLVAVINRLAALQQGIYLSRWPADALARHLSHFVLTLPMALTLRPLVPVQGPPWLLVTAIVPLAFAVIDMSRVYDYARRRRPLVYGSATELWEVEARLLGAVLDSAGKYRVNQPPPDEDEVRLVWGKARADREGDRPEPEAASRRGFVSITGTGEGRSGEATTRSLRVVPGGDGARRAFGVASARRVGRVVTAASRSGRRGVRGRRDASPTPPPEQDARRDGSAHG